MKKIKGNTIKNFDTGAILRKKVKEKNLNYTKMGRLMRRSPNTIKLLLQKTSIQAYILWEFCYALDYNFFADFASWLPVSMPSANTAELEKQIQELKAERDTLQKVVDILGRKGL